MSLPSLIRLINKKAPAVQRLSLLEDIAVASATRTYPFAVTRFQIAIPDKGEQTSITVDSTVWMSPGQNIQIGSVQDGVFVGFYAQITEVPDAETVTVMGVEATNALPGDIVPKDSLILMGVPRGDRFGWVSCDRGFGWTKLPGVENWVPANNVASVRGVFDFPDGKRERTISFTLNKTTGVITVGAHKESDKGIRVSISGNGTEVVTITFIDEQTKVQRQHTLFALNGQSVNGADGSNGIQGKQGPVTLFCGFWNSGDLYYSTPDIRAVVVHWGKLYLAKESELENQNREPTNGQDNVFWKYLDLDFTGLTMFRGLNGGDGIKLTADGDLIVGGVIGGRIVATAKSGSRIALGAISDDHESPAFSHESAGFTDSFKLGIISQHGGTIIASTDGNAPVHPDDIFNPNMLKQSHAFDDAEWVKASTTVYADQITAPDNVASADRLEASGLVKVYQDIPNADVSLIAPENPVTFSVWARGTIADQKIRLSILEYDGLVPIDGKAVSSPKDTLTTGWTRHVISYRIQDPDCDKLVVMIEADGWTGTGSVYLWGAQLEWGLFATPVQETTAARAGVLTIPASTTTVRAKAIKFGSESYERSVTFTHSGGGNDITGKPICIPSDSHFLGSMEITLRTDTSGASIRYTLDGTDPADGGATVVAATKANFTITQTTRIRAIATHPSRDDSAELDVLKSKTPDTLISQLEGIANREVQRMKY